MSTTNVCCLCEERPYDLICTCGDKFDFDCIHQHIEQLGNEIDHNSQSTSDKLFHLNAVQENENKNENVNTAQTIIDNWKRKRIQDIDDIAEKALNEVERRKNILKDIPLIQENFSKICSSLHQPAHSNLNALIDLQHQIQHTIENYENLPTLIQDDTNLDVSLQIKLNPSISFTNNQELRTIDIEPQQFVPNDPIISDTNRLRSPELTNQLTNGTYTVELTNRTHTYELPNEVYTNGLPNEVHINELSNETHTNELPNEVYTNGLSNEVHTNELTSVTHTNDSINDNTNHDEFDAGQTRQIQRINPISIPVNNDRYVGTICCHNDQLIYNDFDRMTRSSRLTFIPNINDLTTKQFIDWYQPDVAVGPGDNEWIQDITYSNKLSGYLILNRARLRLFKDNTNDLSEFQTFFNRTMKRLSCSDTHIYLVVAPTTMTYYGDEIVVMNYNKEEQVCKTFRDILPPRMNRGPGSLVGEISDLTVVSNEQIAIGYRFERRREVGVCLLKVLNDGKEWSCLKQLLLDDCWHNELTNTPRVDWCAKLNSVILIEYMTGHLIMIDKDGQVTGECRFMHVENHRESPINLSVTNNLLCARFESSIVIHKIIS